MIVSRTFLLLGHMITTDSLLRQLHQLFHWLSRGILFVKYLLPPWVGGPWSNWWGRSLPLPWVRGRWRPGWSSGSLAQPWGASHPDKLALCRDGSTSQAPSSRPPCSTSTLLSLSLRGDIIILEDVVLTNVGVVRGVFGEFSPLQSALPEISEWPQEHPVHSLSYKLSASQIQGPPRNKYHQ